MNRNSKLGLTARRWIVLFLFAWLLYSAGAEFYQIAWGSGTWFGEFSPRWLLAFVLFALLALCAWAIAVVALLRPQLLKRPLKKIVILRKRLDRFRWPLAGILFVLPVFLLQYTPWGVVINGFYLRILIWGLVTTLAAILITHGNKELLSWSNLFCALLVSGALIVIAAAFSTVSDYPFSLGWSEGNRLWDYSLLFGRDRYLYSSNQPLNPFLDIGRELLGGLPFIIPGLTILGARLWLAFLGLVPYLLFGFLCFYPQRRSLGSDRIRWGLVVMGVLWSFLFVKQGPIHPPLLLSAILVTLAWRRPIWFALPLIIAAGYFAVVSRGTWLFAPAMWIGMLEFSGAALESGKVSKQGWLRAIALAAAGLFGGVALPTLQRWLSNPSTNQPLLWYRLLPNSTYGNGILLGLLLAVGPLIAVLIYLAAKRQWKLNSLQGLALIAPLLAFLVVGLIVSTKIGGGGDLHNMDMFIIGLAFTAALAWQHGGIRWIFSTAQHPAWVLTALVLLVAIPTVQPLMSLRGYDFAKDEPWLMTLTGTENPRALEMLPSQKMVDNALDRIRTQVDLAKVNGDVLFMDQRQLLTFGYISNVPLVAEYEKKVLMDEALSGHAGYFAPFYEDLSEHRFSLIITEPLYSGIKDKDFVFGEENNAWVTWVSNPVMCYYQPIKGYHPEFIQIRVQLLVPRDESLDCSALLPIKE